MSNRRLVISVPLFFVILASVIAVVVMWWRGSRFQGDGTFTDKGILAYRPRYTVRFPEISLKKPAIYKFQFYGIPTEEFTFALEVPDLRTKMNAARTYLERHPREKYSIKEEKDISEEIGKNQTRVTVTLSSNEQELCSVNECLSNWVLGWTPSLISGEFWHPNLRDIRFRSNRTYTIIVEINEVDLNSPPSALVPVLSGGGIEVP